MTHQYVQQLSAIGWSNKDYLRTLRVILQVCKSGEKPTHILDRLGSNTLTIKAYLVFAKEHGLIALIPDTPKRVIYKTTDKGIAFIAQYDSLIELLQTAKQNTQQ